MKKFKADICIIAGIISVLLLTGSFNTARADHGDQNNGKWYEKFLHDDDDDEKKEHHGDKHRDHDGHHDKHRLTPAPDPVFMSACGSCHWAYPADLLPSASWNKILTGSDDHFGEAVDIDLESKTAILEYLMTNAADKNAGEHASKIMRSLGTQTPLRITEVPYIRKEHHEIGPDVFTREAIGSLANCIACHTTAENGDFDDDNVSIPK